MTKKNHFLILLHNMLSNKNYYCFDFDEGNLNIDKIKMQLKISQVGIVDDVAIVKMY